MTDNSLTIKIEILQRPYKVRVQKEDEEIFRLAGQTIEQSVQKYATKDIFSTDKQDLLAMTLLETMVTALRNERKIKHIAELEQIQDKLISIEDYITKENIDN